MESLSHCGKLNFTRLACEVSSVLESVRDDKFALATTNSERSLQPGIFLYFYSTSFAVVEEKRKFFFLSLDDFLLPLTRRRSAEEIIFILSKIRAQQLRGHFRCLLLPFFVLIRQIKKLEAWHCQHESSNEEKTFSSFFCWFLIVEGERKKNCEAFNLLLELRSGFYQNLFMCFSL